MLKKVLDPMRGHKRDNDCHKQWKKRDCEDRQWQDKRDCDWNKHNDWHEKKHCW